jgi:hypothetical protein
VSKTKLKPAEGLCINLPNGKPALQFIAYKNVTVTTIDKDRRVKCIVEFDEPFIKDKIDVG